VGVAGVECRGCSGGPAWCVSSSVFASVIAIVFGIGCLFTSVVTIILNPLNMREIRYRSRTMVRVR
jgi:hypothetical protein